MPDGDLWLTRVRSAIVAKLTAAAGFAPQPYELSNPPAPGFFVRPGSLDADAVNFHEAFQDGLERWMLTVQAYVGAVADIGAQMLLDRLLSPDSPACVQQLLEADVTLGGLVDDLTVRTVTGYRVYAAAATPNAPLIGCEWSVELEANAAKIRAATNP
jgi:hypothetical protein